MHTLTTLRGYKPLAFIPGTGLLLAKGYSLFTADFECKNIKKIGAVPAKFWRRLAVRIRPLARLLRLGVRYGVQVVPDHFVVAERRSLWLLNMRDSTVQLEHVIGQGARPLSISIIENVAGFADCACFGDYSENISREPVNIWSRDDLGEWNVSYTFPAGTIEHIHALVPDPWRNCVWILTGDFGDAAGIWCAKDNFKEVYPVLTGDQDHRTCWMRVTKKHLFYATDTQMKVNSVRELILPSAQGHVAESKSLCGTAGSSIYASHLGDTAAFSTAVEPGAPNGNFLHDYFSYTPGPGILSDAADLVVGNPDAGFAVWGSWQKDLWPWRLFEYGSINFPTGTNPTSNIYAYFTALKGVDGHLKILTKQSATRR